MKTAAKIFKALADETRLRILMLLLDGELCVCEIIAALELPQSTTSRHLAYLKSAGWVKDRKQGVWMYYRLDIDGDRLCDPLMDVLRRAFSEDSEILLATERLVKFRRDHLIKSA